MRASWPGIEPYRVLEGTWASRPGDHWGAFAIPHSGKMFTVLVSNGDYKAENVGPEYAWEHVSVSLRDRCPSWDEMCFFKSMFWKEDETVMQLHVPAANHKNFHKNCLHLWRPLLAEIPRPPDDTVAR